MRSISRPTVARRGFFLIELMIYIALMAVFAVIAWPFAHRVEQSLGEAQAAVIGSARVDQVMNLLRTDVWDAVEIRSPNQETLVVKNTGGHAVTWSFDAAGNISRKSSSTAEQRWGGLPVGVSFSVRGTIVTVIVPDRGQSHGGRITMISSTMAINGGGR